MCYVAGSNIFRQWFSDNFILDEFRDVLKHKNADFSAKYKILDIKWSYNLLKTAENYFLSGFWEGKENQLVNLPLPPEFIKSSEKNELIVVGNDYLLLIISKINNRLWVRNFKMKESFKEINFNVEEPVHPVNKKLKRDNIIAKVVLVNNSCLYLTTTGDVYCGILPSYVDTRNCIGTICDVCCGYEHYMLLTDTGTLYTWGNGRRLQLGHGDISNLEAPTEVEALAGINIIKIASGGWHSLALSEFGDLYAWGWNNEGQLGIQSKTGEHESLAIPTLVDLYNNEGEEVNVNIKDIACGSSHSLILLEDNSVWSTGCNKYGQLGVSVKNHTKVSSFMKVFQCDNDCTLMCGPWTSVIVS